MTPDQSPKEIEKAVDEFVKGLPKLQKQSFDAVYALLKELTLDSEGNIKSTIANLKVIQRVNRELSKFVDNPTYQDKVVELQSAINKVQSVQTAYYTQYFKDFTLPKSISKLNELAFDSVTEQLVGAGVTENVVNQSVEIVSESIKDGSNFYDMVTKLKDKMLGDKETDPKLVSYSKQVITDTIANFARNYHNIVTDDLEFEFFVYVGAIIDTTRPFCRAMHEKKYIHKSEFAGCISGHLLGLTPKEAHEGMYPDTNAENLINNCAGYNCPHVLAGYPTILVPQEIKDAIVK